MAPGDTIFNDQTFETIVNGNMHAVYSSLASFFMMEMEGPRGCPIRS